MPVKAYECLILLDSSKTVGGVDAVRTQLHTTLEKHGAEILASRPWDDRKLAYTISKQKKGLYYLTFFKMESTKVPTLEADFRLNETILRFLTSAIDPKWYQEMLEVAQTEGRYALMLMTDDSADGIEAPDMGMDRPRRSRDD